MEFQTLLLSWNSIGRAPTPGHLSVRSGNLPRCSSSCVTLVLLPTLWVLWARREESAFLFPSPHIMWVLQVLSREPGDKSSCIWENCGKSWSVFWKPSPTQFPFSLYLSSNPLHLWNWTTTYVSFIVNSCLEFSFLFTHAPPDVSDISKTPICALAAQLEKLLLNFSTHRMG